MPSFLSPLLHADAERLVLRNQRTGTVVASRLVPAFDSASRRTGLLKHTSLSADTALIIAPTNAIHTLFMRFAIDVAFVSKEGRILKIAAHLPPWRLAVKWGGYAVVEMTAGAFARCGTAPSDTLVIE
ncbi:MAG: DUF192 domain-containing protein [Vicinamibacterales bacterium]